MADRRLDRALEECLELLRQGRSLEECLARYPEDAADLEPLLRAAAVVQQALTLPMPAVSRVRVRARVLQEWERRHQARGWWPGAGLFRRWALAAASVAAALVVAGSATTYAAGGALPGDPLYPVKEVREDVQVWLARSPEARAQLLGRLVEERLAEVRVLAERGNGRAMGVAVRRLQHHTEELVALADRVGDELDGAAEPTDAAEQVAHVVLRLQSADEALARVQKDAPPAAQAGLQQAREAVAKGAERTEQALHKKERPKPPKDENEGSGRDGRGNAPPFRTLTPDASQGRHDDEEREDDDHKGPTPEADNPGGGRPLTSGPSGTDEPGKSSDDAEEPSEDDSSEDPSERGDEQDKRGNGDEKRGDRSDASSTPPPTRTPRGRGGGAPPTPDLRKTPAA